MNTTIKAKLAVCTALLAALTLFGGCQSAPSKGTESTPPSIGLVQHTDNQSFTQMRESFIARLVELGYPADCVDVQNAQGDMSAVASIVQRFIDDQKDVIVPVVTPSTQTAVAMDSDIPVIFMSVKDPIAAKIMTNLTAPDKSVTGTSNAIPVDRIFKLASSLTPNVKSYGIIYNTGEANSVSTVEDAKAYLTSQGLSYEEVIVTNSSEVQQAAQSLVGKVEAFFIPLDSMVNAAMPQVAEVAKQAKLPVYTAADTMVMDGGFATVGVSYPEIGRMTADMVHAYLTGTPIAKLPCRTLDTFTTLINKTTAKAIGVTIPDDISAAAQFVE